MLKEHEFNHIDKNVYEASRTEQREVFKKSQMLFELSCYRDRQKFMADDEVPRWFLNTYERKAIFFLFNLSGFPHGHTVNEVSRAVNIARSTTSRLLTEAHTLKFIYRNREEGYQRYYLPSDRLLEVGNLYCEYYVDRLLEVDQAGERRPFYNYKVTELRTRLKLRDGDVDGN
jgi:hypothetical protein